jgi:hypothetical protein
VTDQCAGTGTTCACSKYTQVWHNEQGVY